MTALPIIDLGAYRAGAPEAKAALIEEIAGKSRTLGFFYLVGHGLPQALMDGQLLQARRFFDLPMEDKLTIDMRHSPVRRGYEPMGLQTLQAGAQPDRKEGFSLGRELDPDHPFAEAALPYEGANQWPADAQGLDAAAFRAQMEAWREAMIGLGRELCALIAASLALPEDYFAQALAKPSTHVRLLHYPPQQADPEAGLLGCGAHTDWGFVTLLLQDDCGGLEIQRAEGSWLEASPVPGALIVNLGDMAVRLTAGRYASNVHRVLNRAPNRDRYSVATFFNPNALYQVACVPTCVPAQGAPPPITFADHIQERIRSTYAA